MSENPACQQNLSSLRYWLALNRAPLIGSVRFRQLLTRFGSPEAVFSADRQVWNQAGLPARTIDYLAAPDWAAVEGDLKWLQDGGQPNHCLTLAHPDYPRLLKEISDPPPVLFVRGEAGKLDAHLIAMVGSRNPSPTGTRTAREFARMLAGHGVGIVSGMALGIDAASHLGALEGQGLTIAVVGTGPDRVYPRQHARLADDIIATGGCLVSEYPPGTGPLASNFPRRNRIISGLALGTVIVEAAPKSGSLITARLALEQNRDVFAVPGSIYSPLSKGCNQLIQQGAKLVQEPSDILEEYPDMLPAIQRHQQPQPEAGQPPGDNALLKFIAHEPTTVDTLVALTGLRVDELSAMLLELELSGAIASIPGGAYVRAG